MADRVSTSIWATCLASEPSASVANVRCALAREVFTAFSSRSLRAKASGQEISVTLLAWVNAKPPGMKKLSTLPYKQEKNRHVSTYIKQCFNNTSSIFFVHSCGRWTQLRAAAVTPWEHGPW